MLRQLPTVIETSVSKTITSPAYLVRIGFATERRESTFGDITWNSESWSSSGGIIVTRVGESGGQFSIQNTEQNQSGMLSLSSDIISGDVRDSLVTIYKWYESDAVEVSRGYVSNINISGGRVVFDYVSTTSDVGRAPTERFTSADFNYLPVIGETVIWAGIRITFELPPENF